ncbi:MAG: hypothetical protein HN617_11725 [Planctomycetaceae bacterium]|jgi:hypothetical protein|nr:hypothetical protein [Planctomycetaceae bacterium]MBT4726287.1 hypothetical protein [Planctomycetaceae bacterium]MBT5123835.1 hypothetical protein [Planctomycetaceae bacterium]MBT5598232.1 hypothetical protein [Planctomycetaceae bacterium]MBT5883229.1 hypothetical protein [Planctomycetaceae bacterium]
MHNNSRHPLSLFLLLIVIAGCEWDYPLSPPEDAVADTKLFGVWKLVANYDYSNPSGVVKLTPTTDELSILNIMDAPEDNVFIIGFTEFHKPQLPGESNDKRRTQYAWVTKIGDTGYLNVGSSDSAKPAGGEKDRSFSIVKYELTGNKLVMYVLNKDARSRISSFLGDFYQRDALRNQLTAGKKGDWQVAFEFTRMQ